MQACYAKTICGFTKKNENENKKKLFNQETKKHNVF